MMTKYMVGITTTFDGMVEIEAETADQAMEIANNMLWEGEINTLEFEPDTQVHYAEEV
jgi:hypothetical protein